MPVQSYIVMVEDGAGPSVTRRLSGLRGCRVAPAKNRDALLLVTDTDGPGSEDILRSRVEELPGVEGLIPPGMCVSSNPPALRVAPGCGLDRREFLRRMAMASAASAAFSLMPGVVFGEELDRLIGQAPQRVWLKTPCRLCSVGCGLEVGIEDGRAVAVRADEESPVSRGLACVKGYHSVQSLYGGDRITRALVRLGGQLVERSLDEALDLVADRILDTIREHGKDSVALFGSGEWTIPAGYAASKLFKGALGTNNLEADSRLFSASAAAGTLASFGMAGPVGSYEDIDEADVFVLWNCNMAETHPVLFSRLLDRRRRDPSVSIVDLTTRTTRTSYAADRSLLFAPQADLAIANAVCRELVVRGRVNRDFVDRHVAFRRGETGREVGAGDTSAFREPAVDADWDEYVAFLRPYTPERAEEISGMDAGEIRWLASLYGDRSRRVLSLWGMGVNQHTRGTWMNNLLYNLHLLTGKIAAPGNGALPLPALASSCGTVWNAGTVGHRLPRGVVTSEEDRRRAAEIWGVPPENIDPEPGPHALSMFRALDRGDIRFMWIQLADPMVDLPRLDRYRAGLEREDRFVVVSDAYPTPTTDVADVILPAALWIEEEGLFGDAGRRIHHFEGMLAPPGDATGCSWQLVEVARRLGFEDLFPRNRQTHVEELWTEFARFHDTPARRLPPHSALARRPGALWPWDGDGETKWRYYTARDPAADPDRGEFDFYGHPDGRARIWLRPYEPPPEPPDEEYPFWLEIGRVLEHWPSASLTRRIPTLHRAVPRAYVEINREDAAERGIRDGETVRLVSRRGSIGIEARIDYRGQPPRGQVFVPFFDEARRVNELTLDAVCPVSAQPGYRCAVRLERMVEAGEAP